MNASGTPPVSATPSCVSSQSLHRNAPGCWLADPDILEEKDKTFRLGPTTTTAPVDFDLGGDMPVTLEPGGDAAALQLEVTEDIAAAEADGRCVVH